MIDTIKLLQSLSHKRESNQVINMPPSSKGSENHKGLYVIVWGHNDSNGPEVIIGSCMHINKLY